jgi:hypothetical protein
VWGEGEREVVEDDDGSTVFRVCVHLHLKSNKATIMKKIKIILLLLLRIEPILHCLNVFMLEKATITSHTTIQKRNSSAAVVEKDLPVHVCFRSQKQADVLQSCNIY